MITAISSFRQRLCHMESMLIFSELDQRYHRECDGVCAQILQDMFPMNQFDLSMNLADFTLFTKRILIDTDSLDKLTTQQMDRHVLFSDQRPAYIFGSNGLQLSHDRPPGSIPQKPELEESSFLNGPHPLACAQCTIMKFLLSTIL